MAALPALPGRRAGDAVRRQHGGERVLLRHLLALDRHLRVRPDRRRYPRHRGDAVARLSGAAHTGAAGGGAGRHPLAGVPLARPGAARGWRGGRWRPAPCGCC
ncbi:hypothetical protein WJ972_26830 [Achromobacter insuavis]